jgi:hypothetical protein
MSRDKQEQDLQELQRVNKELEDKLKAAEAKVLAGEEGAMQRVCSALDIDPKKMELTDVVKKEPEMMVECYVPFHIRINQTVYLGKCKVPYSVFGVLSQAIGDYRNRLIRELTGDINVIEALSNGGFASKVVGKFDGSGARIA